MKLRQFAPVLAALALCSASLASHAAQQCLTDGPGTYGAVTVTGCETNAANGITNPLRGTQLTPTFAYDGIGLQAGATNPTSCNLSFNPPIATSSLQLSLDAHQTQDILTISANGNVYTPVAADLSPLSGAVSPNALVISGNTIIGDGSSQDTPSSYGSAGVVQLTNNPPATITSLSLQESVGDHGTLIGVCFDDGAAATTAVPTQSPAGLAGMALMASLLAGWRLRRRRNQR
ncbi:hypothetical protein FVQ98_12560 [Ottowia sp. GY511]|uniref:IPTL-CTERM sorting domain-containing protein n=1 Tax=Ottowia flava TaxID=2675430 RepID=A0ABW4KWD3_9BURK|nr:hypothetical protein [Ottowia sp. GY511]TXK27094.1 hypothetical protein FVQ98_12560 [Ottowia sp. GY511]